MPNRAKDWLAQAEHDLEHAEASRRDGRHGWACFAAQQAAEGCVKAVHLWMGQEARGHDVARLLCDLPVQPSAHLVEKAKVLDNFYIPTRDPRFHSEGAAFEHYGPIQSDAAIAYAREIVEYARVQMAQPRDG
jgi:HEPN domain-containing protein